MKLRGRNGTNLRDGNRSNLRVWLLLGTVLSGVIFFPGAYMAVNAVALAMNFPSSGFVLAVALLFQVLPAFCILCPFAAWRLYRKRPEDRNAVIMIFAPVLYAAFLIAFLLAN
jgi:hypothetical protein